MLADVFESLMGTFLLSMSLYFSLYISLFIFLSLSHTHTTGALYIDLGLDACRKMYAMCLFPSPREADLKDSWLGYMGHPFEAKHPGTDRHLVNSSPTLTHFAKFEDLTGIFFNHISLLVQVSGLF